MAKTKTLCDSCKTTSASLFCKADSAFLCIPCDGKVHEANKLASRHERVWLCEVCEQAPASVTCKADAASLCVTCDHDIHSANPLARRHQRFPVVPFHDPATAVAKLGGCCETNDSTWLLDCDVNGAENVNEEEAEADLWLLPNPNLNMKKIGDGCDEDEDENNRSLKVTEYLFSEIDTTYGGGVDLKTPDLKGRFNSQTDGVVPVVQNKSEDYQYQNLSNSHGEFVSSDVVEGLPAYDYAGSKPFMYNFTSQSISQSVSSSEIEVGVVPDHNGAMADVSNRTDMYPTPLVGFDREARVMRYREKKKNRKFEKTIRYASRKAYAETRPRIKGRFAKRTEMDVEADEATISPDSSYGVVPTY